MKSLSVRRPDHTVFLSKAVFEKQDETAVYWLSGAGVLINSHGISIMIDPCLSYVKGHPSVSEICEPLLLEPPLSVKDAAMADAVFYTHIDPDHAGRQTLRTLAAQDGIDFYGTPELVQLMRYSGVRPSRRHEVVPGNMFRIGEMTIEVTKADHPWQLGMQERFDWVFNENSCCGYKISTADGTIWIPGDTRLLDEHLKMGKIDLLFIDFSDDPMHFGREDAIRLANYYNTDMIMYHYATYDAPDKPYHCADPADVVNELIDPDKLRLLAPGEKYILSN